MKIVETKNKVRIGRFTIDGFIDDIAKCTKCGSERIYHEDYDSYICPYCNIWLEKPCSDRTCEFCSKRPIVPLPPIPNPNHVKN